MCYKIFIAFVLISFLPSYLRADDGMEERNEKILISDQRISDLKDNTHILYAGNETPKDSLSKLLNMFYYDQFRHFQDPRAPYFMFLSKNGQLALGVGGEVKVSGYFDWNGSIPDIGFIPYDIPIPKDPANMKALSATPAGTGLFFTLLGSNKLLGNFMAYFEADFNGYNGLGFQIWKAYFTFKKWTVGYATSTFEDTMAEPATVDVTGPNSINSKQSVLVRFINPFKNHWTVAASIEFPQQAISADGVHTQACSPFLPDLVAFLQYQWDNSSSHLRLSGLYRTLSYRDLVKRKNYNIPGWGAQLSTIVNPLPSLSLFGIASIGQGHASYTADLGNGEFDLIPVTDQEGKLYAPLATGFVVGLQYFYNKKIFSNLAFSQQNYYPKKNPEDSNYRYGYYAVGNVFWDITPRVEIGLEYLHGKRKNFNGESASANRLMGMLSVSF